MNYCINTKYILVTFLTMFFVLSGTAFAQEEKQSTALPVIQFMRQNQDKLHHIVYSAFFYKVFEDWAWPEAAFWVAMLGVSKEFYDEFIGITGFDFIDLLADGTGILLGEAL